MEYKLAPLIPGEIYHLHNKANAGEKLFITPENYRFFFEKYRHYISVIAHTFCYSILPDNFHLLVRFKKEGELVDYFTKNKQYIDDFDKMITMQFTEFFNAYSKEMHKKQNKKGDLFMPILKRKRITDREYLKNVVYFIHNSPVDAGLAKEPYEYEYSSYNEIINRNSRVLKTEDVLEWFEGVDGFAKFHQNMKETPRINFVDER